MKIPCQKKLHRKQCLLSQDAEEDQDSTPIDEGIVSFDLYFYFLHAWMHKNQYICASFALYQFAFSRWASIGT